ncbi:DUF6984 family protein [Marinagarivorans algicola]|uniref:DUF6984 family protein n=1 Tax=Marinagarivorans algicola TaxID=1513270 RepID=UPI0009E88059|nr:hypothetical protein [Marinagarivorans algicola]
MVPRKPTKDENKLINYLLEKFNSSSLISECESFLVSSMDDGGMGSLKLYPKGLLSEFDGRVFGSELGDCHFNDEDGVKVIATIYLDEEGCLFELDMWKQGDEPLIQIPDSFE